MNKANLKSYAPQARRDFIAAVTARANQLGLSSKAGALEVAPAQTQGDVTVIAGQAWPAKIDGQRDKLIARIRKDGFDHTMEAVAYTWFNRFAALRYMELHDYLGHGHRALSSSAGGLPDILTHAADLSSSTAANALPGLNAAIVTELKLAGNRDGELYRMLLVAQCNALSRAMPFLFERIDDDSELLLPDNLLRSDSVIAKLVEEIPEEDWAEVEIIGWLYQFYISEKKDQVIGKVVKSEDIPAATQLFTPNWIVQYLVQNSVGRLWLMANPQSTLTEEWPYYITPAEQTPEVQAELDALIQTRVSEDGDTLNPESITVLDPACGSGHILVVAYDVLKAIYLERGFQPRAIPRLILEKNLYGLDIDDRAAQMACFALLMKARADDRRLFTTTDDAGNLQPPKLNVFSLQESKGLSADELATHLSPFKVQRATITALVDAFEHAKTFGSLIQIPYALKNHLAALPQTLALVKQSGDMYATAAAEDFLPLVQQAQVLAMQFDAVVANPPYMGNKFLSPILKSYLRDNFYGFEKDLFSAFMIRDLGLTKESGQLGFMSPFVWMFISSYEELRRHFIDNATLTSLVQLEYSGFDGATVPICAFTLSKQQLVKFWGSYVRLSNFRGADQQGPRTLEAIRNPSCGWFYTSKQEDFKKIPGSPIAYWVTEKMRLAFLGADPLGKIAQPRQGMATTNNSLFVRLWFECSRSNTDFTATSGIEALESRAKWFPYNKGGDFRRWYGNNLFVVNYENAGKTICDYIDNTPGVNVGSNGRVINREKYFKPSITWSKISSSSPAFRYIPNGFIFDVAGTSIFFDSIPLQNYVLGFCNSSVATKILQILSPTLNFEVGHISTLPIKKHVNSEVITPAVKKLIAISRSDWDSFESSWDFRQMSWVSGELKRANLIDSWHAWSHNSQMMLSQMKSLEEENNRIFTEAYNLQNEIAPEVPESQISLARADREKDCQRLISFCIGCMMGRYSLDEPGLIYAHSGNVGFEPSRYATFPADADGIVPITDELWFADDAPSRIREFLCAVWGPNTLEENLAWLAESLGAKTSETPDETIRRYISDKFFKDQEAPHLLALQQRQTRRIPGAGLSAPIPRGHARPYARRIRCAPHRQNPKSNRDAAKGR